VYDGFTIPDIPQMVGSVFLLQSVLSDGSVIYISDVLGALVLPAI
jgi:hypothetical protein